MGTPVPIFVIIIGSITYASGVRVFTANLGALELPAALVMGLLASFSVDALAVKAFTNLGKRRSTSLLLKSIKQQRQIVIRDGKSNELVTCFYGSQVALIKKIEGIYLASHLPVRALVACLLSILEFVIAFWMVEQLNFLAETGISLRVVAASLPVVLTWAAAKVQCEYVELPHHCKELIPQYQEFLFPGISLLPQEVDKVIEQKLYEDGRLHAGITFILDGDPSDVLKNLGMAYTQYDRQYYQQRLEAVAKEHNDARITRIRAFQDECDHLLKAAPQPELKRENMSDQQVRDEQARIRQAQQDWVEQQLPHQKKRLEEDLFLIDEEFNQAKTMYIAKCEAAQEAYEAAYQAWRDRQEQPYSLF